MTHLNKLLKQEKWILNPILKKLNFSSYQSLHHNSLNSKLNNNIISFPLFQQTSTLYKRSYSKAINIQYKFDLIKFKALQDEFYKENKVKIIHFGSNNDYKSTINCIYYIQENFKEKLIPGVSLMLYDGTTILGEDLTLIKVNNNIIESEFERKRLEDLLLLLNKVLYRKKMTPTEIQRWNELRGNGIVLPDYFRDILMTRRFGVKGRTILGIFVTDSDFVAYGVVIVALITLISMAIFGSYKKKRDMERAEENFVRKQLKEEQEKRQKERLTEMALERQKKSREGSD